MSDSPFQTCSECGRAILQQGSLYVVEAAWDKKAEHPVVAELLTLYGNKKHLDALATLDDRMKRYCESGQLRIPQALNELLENLWEFKGGTVRLVFYFAGEQCGRETLRVTHTFVKKQQRTPRKEIVRGEAIARIDSAR